MADNTIPSNAGGFVPQSLPSPAPTTSSVMSVAGLPHPRAHALRPGSAKEDQVRNFVSDRMAHMTRRFLKKTGGGSPGNDDVVGYTSVAELCKDLEEVINIIWLSGTRRYSPQHERVHHADPSQQTCKSPSCSTSPANSTRGWGASRLRHLPHLRYCTSSTIALPACCRVKTLRPMRHCRVLRTAPGQA